MTQEQISISTALGKVRYLPASFDKRLGRSLAWLAVSNPEKEITAKQDEWMYRLLYKYRKQLPVTYERYKSNPFCSKAEPRKHEMNVTE